jgi:hypothetical protein
VISLLACFFSETGRLSVIRPWRLPVLHLLFIPMIYKQADCRHLVIGGYPSYIVVFFTSCQLARNGRLAVFIFFLSSLRSRNLHLFFFLLAQGSLVALFFCVSGWLAEAAFAFSFLYLHARAPQPGGASPFLLRPAWLGGGSGRLAPLRCILACP